MSRAAPATGVLSRLFRPVDIASLVFFRVAFGALMLWEVIHYFGAGWIDRYFVAPRFHFTFPGFSWVTPWPAPWMHVHFFVLGVLAVCIMLGLWYRIAAFLFLVGFTYVFLLDQARYLNHFYLVSLVSFLLCIVPAHRAGSLDVLRRPRLHSRAAPAWSLWLLRFQMGIVYLYGGVAKLNADWLGGEPVRTWIAEKTGFPLVGRYFTEEWMVHLVAWGGMLLDLLVVPLLLWRRTRAIALLAAFVFHIANSQLFRIGIFPWLAAAATLLYLPPDWPRLRWLRRAGPAPAVESGVPMPAFGRRQRVLVGVLGAWVLLQVLIPLRPYLHPGNPSWNEEGHYFAWHMKLHHKDCRGGFAATSRTSGERWEVPIREFLAPWQIRQMLARPDLILQFSHHVADHYRRSGRGEVAVRAEIWCSLNAREPRLLVDPTVDLAGEERLCFRRYSWVLSLEAPARVGSAPHPAH